jgi:hypothetical protein
VWLPIKLGYVLIKPSTGAPIEWTDPKHPNPLMPGNTHRSQRPGVRGARQLPQDREFAPQLASHGVAVAARLRGGDEEADWDRLARAA